MYEDSGSKDCQPVSPAGNIREKLTGMGIWITSIFIIYIIFSFICYFTPPLGDDYYYMQRMGFGTGERLDNIPGFIKSVTAFYNLWGGRVLGYAFTVILNTIPRIAFALITPAVYLLLVFLIYKICNLGKKADIKLFLLINIFFWLFIPDYGQVMFWTSGSSNYLYPAVFALLPLLVFRKFMLGKGDCFKNVLWIFPAFLLGIIAGIGMENTSAGMLVVLTLYIIYFYVNKKAKIQLTPGIVSLYIGCIAGFAILFFAPGNSARAEAGESLGFIFKCFITCYYWVFFGLGIFMVICILVWCRHNKDIHIKNSSLAQSYFYYAASVLSAACLIAAPTIAERAWFSSTVYGVAAAGILFADAENTKSAGSTKCTGSTKDTGNMGNIRNIKLEAKTGTGSTFKIISLVMVFCGCIFCLVSMADTAICTYEIHKQYIQREEYILAQKEAGNTDVTVPVFSYKYPFRSKHDALEGLSDITTDSSFWINQAVASYYGINSVIGVVQYN